jgi:hypothetical protein
LAGGGDIDEDREWESGRQRPHRTEDMLINYGVMRDIKRTILKRKKSED